jgi:polypeptide N-acetylgalactosaminyltransferase
MRAVEIWMDSYKEYFYTREPQIRSYNFGDISEQLELRNRLNCKSFDWYVNNIAFDLLKYYPLPPRNKVWGEVCYSFS